MIKSNIGIEGFFTIKIRSLIDNSIIRELFFKNLTLDNGLDEFGLNKKFEDSCKRCYLGVNATPPTQTDTLNTMNVAGNYATSGVDNEFSWQNNNEYMRFRNFYHFTPTSGVGGVVLTEIGVGFTTGVLLARTLIKDEVGNPASITLLATEYLDVMYDLHVYPMLNDVTGTRTIGADTYGYTVRSCNIGKGANEWRDKIIPLKSYYSSEVNLSSKNNYPTGIGSTTLFNLHNYVQGSFQRTVDFTFNLANANLAVGVSLFSFAGSGDGYVQAVAQIKYMKQGAPDLTFGTNFPKTASNELNIQLIVSWGRH